MFIDMKRGRMMMSGMELKFKWSLRGIGQLIVYVQNHWPMLILLCGVCLK